MDKVFVTEIIGDLMLKEAEQKVSHDATASIGGNIYQFCVALEQAFLLRQNQKLWIEKFGDVTVSGLGQFEIKNYQDSLTDNHLNFWKTLYNWLQDAFDHHEYQSLVLYTTQPIGELSKFKNWNPLSPQDKFEILQLIWQESENRFKENEEKSSQNDEKKAIKPPKSLVFQRKIFSTDNLVKLSEIIPKVHISSNSPGSMELCEKILDIYAKEILFDKRNDFLEGLLGYFINPAIIESGWEISYDDFSGKLASLKKMYQQGTVVFPRKYIEISKQSIDLHNYQAKNFVKKLHSIEYAEVINDAIDSYFIAHHTISTELRTYQVDPSHYTDYRENLHGIHKIRYRKASRNAVNEALLASQNFYDDLTGEAPQQLYPFENTPLSFRNGVFHILADEEDDFHWKLII